MLSFLLLGGGCAIPTMCCSGQSFMPTVSQGLKIIVSFEELESEVAESEDGGSGDSGVDPAVVS